MRSLDGRLWKRSATIARSRRSTVVSSGTSTSIQFPAGLSNGVSHTVVGSPSMAELARAVAVAG